MVLNTGTESETKQQTKREQKYYETNHQENYSFFKRKGLTSSALGWLAFG